MHISHMTDVFPINHGSSGIQKLNPWPSTMSIQHTHTHTHAHTHTQSTVTVKAKIPYQGYSQSERVGKPAPLLIPPAAGMYTCSCASHS